MGGYVDPAVQYHKLCSKFVIGHHPVEHDKEERLKVVQNWNRLIKRDAEHRHGDYGHEVMCHDAAMWYGALTTDKDAGLLIRNVFGTLYYGKLFVWRDNTYLPLSQLGAPIATALSHGGRVLIQLPMVSSSQEGCHQDEFWHWFWPHPQRRMIATHSISPREGYALKLDDQGRMLHLHEGGLSPLARGHHYGMNVALGGIGNENPWSRQMIFPDGRNGHLYIYYLPPTDREYGGLLVGCEGSAPYERAWTSTHRGLLPDTMDQTGHEHTVWADSSKYSPTGGLKFADTKVVGKTWYGGKIKQRTDWCHAGPTKTHEGLVIDLAFAHEGRETMTKFVMDRTNNDFQHYMLGRSGYW
jgi:hypothetical protein